MPGGRYLFGFDNLIASSAGICSFALFLAGRLFGNNASIACVPCGYDLIVGYIITVWTLFISLIAILSACMCLCRHGYHSVSGTGDRDTLLCYFAAFGALFLGCSALACAGCGDGRNRNIFLVVAAFDIGFSALFCTADLTSTDFKTVMGIIWSNYGLPLAVIMLDVCRGKGIAHCYSDIIDSHTFPIDKGTLVRIPDFIDSVWIVLCQEFIEICSVRIFAQKLLDKLEIVKVIHAACNLL